MALKDKLMTLEDFKAVRDVDVASNSAQFTEIKADLGNITGNIVIDFTVGKCIYTNDATADINAIRTNATYAYAVLDCAEGDAFTITGYGGNSPRLWAFLGAESNGSRPVLSNATAGYRTTDELITAPENAQKIVVNVLVSTPYSLIRGEKITKRLNDLSGANAVLTDSLDDVQTDINNILTSSVAIDAMDDITTGYYVSAGQATFGQLRSDENCYATRLIKVQPNSVIQISNTYLDAARGVIGYSSEKIAVENLASNKGSAPVNITVTIPRNVEYIRITGRISFGDIGIEYRSLVLDVLEGVDLDSIKKNYTKLTFGATEGRFISGVSGGTPSDATNCATDFIRVRAGATVKTEKIVVTGNRAISAYDKNQTFLRAVITGSTETEYTFVVAEDVYYIRATGATGISPDIWMTEPNIKDTENFYSASNILIPYTFRSAVNKKIVTYIDDDALSETGLDLLKQSCDRLGIKCSIAAIAKILESTPSRVTYLKGLEAEGFHICNHTNDHSRWYTDYEGETMFTLAEVEQDLIKSIQILDGFGFIDASKYFVYPGSSCNRAGITEVVKKWTELACTISSGNNRIQSIPRTLLYRCPINYITHPDLSYYQTQLADLTVEGDNNWIIYYSHCKSYAEGQEWNQTLFEQVIQNAMNNGYTVMTLNEAWQYRKSMWMMQEAFGR